MAKAKIEKTEKAVKKEKKVEVKSQPKADKKELTLPELRVELQRVILQVRSGEESDTSKIKKLKKQIARELTKVNKK